MMNHFPLKATLLGSAALAATILSVSGASAQSCLNTPLQTAGLPQVGQLAASTASSIASSIGNLNTIFLTQQTSAFVSAPSGVAPDTQGGGVWTRGLVGEAKISSTSTTNIGVASPLFNENGTINCQSRERLTFQGVEVGQDISRLNLEGYNIHFGTSAGYLHAKSTELNGPNNFTTDFEVPFVSVYGVLTKDSFFADVNLRYEYYNAALRDPTLSLYNQPVDAHGYSLSFGAGYNIALGNGWFVEPSSGAVFSWTKVDPFTSVGLPQGQLGSNISGTVSFDDIKSGIGRATVRAGRNFTAGNLALQPFVTASVFAVGGGTVTSHFQSCPNCVFASLSDPAGNVIASAPAIIPANTDTSPAGTFGQFSAGVAGLLLNTGWLGFVRGDYRTGENINGWIINAGLRYQYSPIQPAAVFSKGPQPVASLPVYWTGFYLGGYFGGGYGNADIGFVGDATANRRVSGWLGGGQLGYNYQIGGYVLGVEGDFGGTSITGSKTCGAPNGLDGNGFPGGFSPYFMTCASDLDWIATAAARVGMTWNRALFYIKAGAAWTEETVSANCIIGPNNVTSNLRQCINQAGLLVNYLDASANRTGWLVGYGAEFALTPNWSAKAEYKYMDFGDQGYTASDGSRLTSDLQVSTVTIGVNYRFSTWSGPVVAKY